MENILVATLGESPAVITEAIDEFGRSGIGINRVKILYTKAVYRYLLILKIEFKHGVYNDRIRLEEHKLPFEDVTNEEDILQFRRILFNHVRESDGRVYLLIAGGRKSMVVDATLIALACGLDSLYYVRLPPSSGVLRADSLVANYNLEEYEHKPIPNDLLDKINEICHPRLKGNLIRVPLPLLDKYSRESLVSGLFSKT